MATYARRVSDFKETLGEDQVNLARLSELCLEGIPDTPRTYRPLCWRILLGYEPLRRSERSSFLRKQRREYYDFVNDLLVDPFIEARREIEPFKSEKKYKRGKKAATSAKIDTNPLNDDPKYTEYYADNLVLEQIDKDVRRTLADIAFFQQPVPVSHLSPLSPHLKPKLSMDVSRPSLDMQLDQPMMTAVQAPIVEPEPQLEHEPPIRTRRTIFARLRHLNKDFGNRDRSPRPSVEIGQVMANRTSLDEEDVEDLHWESIERILFVYAKLNPAIKYVQGMNELLAPLYFVLANDESTDHRAHAEADSFYCFTALMAECRDLFERTHDHNTSDDAGRGISAVLTRFMERLRYLDPALHEDMTVKEIEPAYFAFRWYCCLMAQEFDLPDVIRLWDSILADRSISDAGSVGYLTDFCCALLINVREQLISQPFADNIKLLQQYPPQDIGPILALALDLRKQTGSEASSGAMRRFMSDFKLPQFNFERTLKTESSAESKDISSGTPFRPMQSFSTLLGSMGRTGSPTKQQVVEDEERQSMDFVSPPAMRLHTSGQQVFHAPPSDEAAEASSRLSYEFTRPPMPSISLAGAKKWFSAVPEDSELDPAGDSRFGLLKSKSTSFFRKAGAFVSNIPISSSDDAVYDERHGDGRVSPVADKGGRRSRSNTLKR